MMRRVFIFPLLIASLAAQTTPAKPVASIAQGKNFRLPEYDNQGRRTRLLIGSEARYISATQIEVIDMRFTLFAPAGSTATANSADPKNPPIDTVLDAPIAFVQLKDKEPIASGDESVHIVRADIDATGEKWMYVHGQTQKKLWLGQNVRVIFKNTELKHLLK